MVCVYSVSVYVYGVCVYTCVSVYSMYMMCVSMCMVCVYMMSVYGVCVYVYGCVWMMSMYIVCMYG